MTAVELPARRLAVSTDTERLHLLQYVKEPLIYSLIDSYYVSVIKPRGDRRSVLIDAPSSTKNQDGKRDPEMRQTKKGYQ